MHFIDKVTRKQAWPKYARFVFMDPPDCTGYADETSVSFVKPPFDEERCSQLIHDGDAENLPDKHGVMGQWQAGWFWDMQLKLVTGYGGVGQGVQAYHQDDCTNKYCSIGQWLDSSCFVKWVRLDLEAKVRILDRDGDDYVCQETDQYCGVACEFFLSVYCLYL